MNSFGLFQTYNYTTSFNKISLYTFGIPIKGKNIVYVVDMFLN